MPKITISLVEVKTIGLTVAVYADIINNEFSIEDVLERVQEPIL